jgi:cytidylate kinase
VAGEITGILILALEFRSLAGDWSFLQHNWIKSFGGTETMATPSAEKQLTAELAERQMQRRTLLESFLQPKSQSAAARSKCTLEHRYIAISREAGSGGTEVAFRVGERLGWKVLDRNLLDTMAERARAPRHLLEVVDDGYPGWFFETFGCWFNRRLITQARYLVHLKSALQEVLEKENAVIVGRGAQFLLPRECGLAVRIIAPEPYRIEQMRARYGLDYFEARKMVRRLDAERRHFVKQTFGQDINNPYLYDLLINIERCGLDGTVELVVAAAEKLLFQKR